MRVGLALQEKLQEKILSKSESVIINCFQRNREVVSNNEQRLTSKKIGTGISSFLYLSQVAATIA